MVVAYRLSSSYQALSYEYRVEHGDEAKLGSVCF